MASYGTQYQSMIYILIYSPSSIHITKLQIPYNLAFYSDLSNHNHRVFCSVNKYSV